MDALGPGAECLGVLVLVLVVTTAWRPRSRDYAALRMSGVPLAVLRRASALEQGTVVVVAGVAGILCGLLASRLALPMVPLFTRPSATFLADLRRNLQTGDHLLLGADLVKSPQILVPAYDDAAGVTAAFNLNVLEVLNHRLGAGFRRSDFTHVAIWDAEHEWIEMRLRAGRDIATRIEDVDLDETEIIVDGKQLTEERATVDGDLTKLKGVLGSKGLPLAQDPQPFMVEGAKLLTSETATTRWTVAIAAILIVLAFAIKPRRAALSDRVVPRPWLLGLITFILASLHAARSETWGGVALGIALVIVATLLIRHWSRQRRFESSRANQDRHPYALKAYG